MAEPGIHRIEVTTLGDLLDLRAAELGEHLAMVFPDHQVTYAGLAERADFFARGLLAAGLKPGETKRIRGKLYVVPADVPALVRRYERDFPEHVGQ